MQDTWPGLPALQRTQFAFGPGRDPASTPTQVSRVPAWIRPRRGVWEEPPRYQHSYIYGVEYVDNTSVADLAASAIDTIFSVNVDGSAAFYATKLTGVFGDARFMVQMRRGADGQTHFSRRVPASMCIGSGNLPFPLVPPVWLRPSSTWQFLLSDSGGGKQSIRLGLHGVAVYPEHHPAIGPRVYRGWDYQEYVIRFDALPTGGSGDAQAGAVGANLTASAPAVISGEGDFLCYGMTMEATGGFLIDLTISGSKLKPFDRPIHAGNLGATTFGASPRSAQAPYWWPVEFLFPARTTLSAAVTDLSGASNSIAIGFFGMRLLLAG